MPGHYAPHVPGYAYTTSQPSTSHATNTSYDTAPNASMTDAARSEPPISLGFHSEAMSGYPSRSLPTQHTSNSSSFARHFQHYDQIPLSGNYGHLDPAAAQHHDHIGQSTLPFPQSAAISPNDGHELQNAFLNDSMAPPGTVMPGSSEHIDPMTTRPLMRTSPPISTISKRPRQDSLSQSDSVKRARTSDRVRAPGSSLPYPDDAWELSAFSMSSQQSRTLSRPTSELSGVNSPFHPDNRGSSGLNPGPQFLASPPSDRPQSANSLPQSPEIRTMNGIAQGTMHGAGFRPFASPQRRFSSASSHTFVPPSIPDGPTSQSPTLPGHPTPGGVSPYYTPPSSGLRPSTGTASASSFASTSRLGAADALVTTSSDDGSSNVSHSLGETEMIASFPQFYERVRALCLKFNDDAANLLRATPHDVLAQSFQMGTGPDPMRMLNDAKAICERMMHADSTARARVPGSSHLEGTMLHGLSYSTSAYPPPFNSHWSPRLSSHPATPSGVDEEYFTQTQLPKGYGSDPTIQRDLALARPPSVDVSFNNSTLRSAANVNHGTWRDEESEKLRQLAEHSRATSKLNGQDKIDWDWVVERFGASRTRHQILIKATHLGLKPTSTHPSRIRKRLAKAEAAAAAAQAATTPSSSAPPATEAANPVHQDTMTSPTSAPRHYPPHVLNQTVDTRPKSGETLQTTTSNSDSIPPYEPGGSA